MRALAFALLATLLAFGASGAKSRDEVYVWQRHWTPPLREALLASRNLFGGVRVLVAQETGRVAGSAPKPRRPILPAIRDA